ncbi:MAG: hypothetical protein K2W82_03410 [Candidatus Obscuribacterales bacterium]|nr:hypothetical protein [Candidatus Obscuribacterales bacterium]
MWAAAWIKRHIACLEDDKPFSTRDFLRYGSRGAIDQTLWRLVKKGEIVRVARGLFIRKGAEKPTIKEVAEAKAKAFGRTIIAAGEEVAKKLGLIEAENISETVYAVNGRSSSFRCGEQVIKLQGTSPRKMGLRDDDVGEVIRALWHKGKAECRPEILKDATQFLNRRERQELRDSEYLMPYWMQNLFLFFRKESPRLKKPAKNKYRFG